MTQALAILTAWTLASIPVALLVGRFMSPSLCERDAQDGRGDLREGLRFVTHVSPIKTKLEQDNV